jgi:hypothetical protein
MIEFLRTFEHRAIVLQPPLLIAMAVVTFAAGLFVWLGGLGCKKVLFAIIGAYCGAACTIFISGSNLLLTAALAGIGILLAMKLQNTFLILMASIFAVVYGFSTLILPYVGTSAELIAIIRQLTIGVPYYNWLILLVLVAAPFAVSLTFSRGASAVLCSAAGTCLMLAGAIMLLVRSGFAAGGYISIRREFCLELFVAATALGAIAQLFLLPTLVRHIAAAKEAIKVGAKQAQKDKCDDSDALPRPKTTTWRTA